MVIFVWCSGLLLSHYTVTYTTSPNMGQDCFSADKKSGQVLAQPLCLSLSLSLNVLAGDCKKHLLPSTQCMTRAQQEMSTGRERSLRPGPEHRAPTSGMSAARPRRAVRASPCELPTTSSSWFHGPSRQASEKCRRVERQSHPTLRF